MDTLRIVLYVRVSSLEQAEEGASLAAQELRLRAWASVLGHEVVALISDAGVSGKIKPDDRVGFAEAMRLLRANKADGIAAVALDRISRSLRDILDLTGEFSRRGWAILSMRESIDPTTPLGRLFLNFLGSIAQYESELIGERTSIGLAQRKREGTRYSRFIPWGKTHIEGTKDLVVCESEALISGAALRMSAEGLHETEIAARLNAEVSHHPRTCQPWTRKSVQILMRALARSGQRAPKKRHRRS